MASNDTSFSDAVLLIISHAARWVVTANVEVWAWNAIMPKHGWPVLTFGSVVLLVLLWPVGSGWGALRHQSDYHESQNPKHAAGLWEAFRWFGLGVFVVIVNVILYMGWAP